MRIARYTFGLMLCLLFFSVPVNAVTVTDPPEPINYAPIFVTGFQMTDQLDAVEIYNGSSDPVDLSSWSLQYQSSTPGEVCKISLQDWLIPSEYVVVVATNVVLDDPEGVLFYNPCPRSSASNFSFTLNNSGSMQETIGPIATTSPAPNAFVRKDLAKTHRTGTFSTDFIANTRSFYKGGWYTPPESLLIQFSEILVNSRNCSPLESALDCSDYVKLYNPTDQSIDLSDYRLRNGYLGQTPSSSNTMPLEGILEPGHYLVFPMSVINSTDWLWVEDIYGVKQYNNTVTNYPDGSSDTKKGQAWAYDDSDGAWKWTTQPTPSDAPSVFPALITEQSTVATITTSNLTPCKDGQYRSEETNRCRNIEAVTTNLIPCAEGEERNPDTNRCRSIMSVLGASDLAPCKTGQERNPDTNRCRNVVSAIPKADYAPRQTTNDSNNYIIWLSLAVVGVVAVGYGIWEWRQEINSGRLKLLSFLKHRK